MKKISHVALAALGFCAAFSAAPSFAKDYYAQDGYAYEGDIVVTAPYSGRRTPDRVSRAVSYKDLDLRYEANVNVLRERIEDTASWACARVGERGDRDCINDAIRTTDPQVRRAVWRARA